jgi:hypothetical protein
MKKIFSISLLVFIMACNKAKVDPAINKSEINADCLVKVSEVPYDKILDQNRDGFIKIEQKFAADGTFISANTVGIIFGKEIGMGETLKSFSYNGQVSNIVANGYYNVNSKKEAKTINVKIGLQDNSIIEICLDKLPKVIKLNNIPKPVADKEWTFDLDLTDNGADEIATSDNFLSVFFSNLNNILKGEGSKIVKFAYDKEDVAEASNDAKEKKLKDFAFNISTSKAYLVTKNGKKIHISVENITESRFPVF